MWTNDVTLIAGQQVAVRAFSDEHIEVVEPEIGHHFLQLPLAVDGAQHLLLGQLDDEGVRVLSRRAS